jgi:hypothetical protein
LDFLKRHPSLERLALRIPSSRRPLNRALVVEEGSRIISIAAMDHGNTETDDSADLSKISRKETSTGRSLVVDKIVVLGA